MKLITHNFLRCQAKECADTDMDVASVSGSYPLKIKAETIEDDVVELVICWFEIRLGCKFIQ